LRPDIGVIHGVENIHYIIMPFRHGSNTQ
jgi:hypothetical protein